MQRVMIIGISGAGKSTLARALEATYGLPAYHLDNIYHAPGWVARPPADVQRDFEAIAMEERWVVDGNFRRLTGCFRDRADTLIFLDYGRFYCLWQVIRRWAFHKLGLRKRIDLADGFGEQLPFSFMLWVWRWHRDNRPNWLAELAKYPEKAKVFRSRKELNAWMETL